MNVAQTKMSRATQIGTMCALVGVTVLLTVLFSFLGTLTVAVVAGLVMGAGRRWRWSAIPVSLVFPAVIFGLSACFKIQLPPEKVHLIALVCGAAFWAVYGMTFGLHLLEQKPESPAATTKGRADLPGGTGETETSAAPEFTLATLRGSWTCADASANGSSPRKTLRIEDGRFALTVSEPGSQPREVARGELSVAQSKTGTPVVTLSEHQPNHADGI